MKMPKWFCKPAATEVAKGELEEAQRQLVIADVKTEYYRHRAQYLRASIAQLKKVVQPQEA